MLKRFLAKGALFDILGMSACGREELMNNIRKLSVIASIILFAISLTACSDQLVQEAIFRTLGETYRAQQMQAVTPGGQFRTGFAAGIFEQLAEDKRQQRLYREVQRSYEDQYARQLEEQARQNEWQEQVMKARSKVEVVLLQDKTSLRQWVNHFNEWTNYCKQNVRYYPPDSYCGFAESLLADFQTFQSRLDFYLANLPAYYHINMDVRKTQLEIDDYRSKKDRLEKRIMAWTDAMTRVEEEIKEGEEKLREIEAEQRRF